MAGDGRAQGWRVVALVVALKSGGLGGDAIWIDGKCAHTAKCKIGDWLCLAAIVLAFFGNQYLPQSKKASLKSLQYGKLVRSFGYVTMLECMRQSVGLTGIASPPSPPLFNATTSATVCQPWARPSPAIAAKPCYQ
ncbi:hypothetical protein SESBI_45829 [Sesbania bispinosa]|nr:hypothetical protein SESBI_45829 [Sesbania bispinosa]